MNAWTAIAWTGLSASVRQLSANEKCILDDICGGFEFSSINALMGSSGSGKTTLIKCLNASNRYVLSEDSKIFVNQSVKIVSCFVSQNQSESLVRGLTVKQALMYSSRVKNSGHKSGVNHSEIVYQLMDELLIRDVCDQRIERCSGGQHKRIAIALELTSRVKPNLLFMDEPTTGLDSNAAHIVSLTRYSLLYYINFEIYLIYSFNEYSVNGLFETIVQKSQNMCHNEYTSAKQ
jgi:ABC-type multidrug transport system ATPase subunit